MQPLPPAACKVHQANLAFPPALLKSRLVFFGMKNANALVRTVPRVSEKQKETT
jgi:hypothetical protein